MENPFHYNHPPVTKVPGSTNIKNEYALKIVELEKLPRRELLDIESRQSKLLKNKKFINNLPDKGKKIQDLYDRVVEALKYKNEIHNAANLLSSLSLGSNNLNNLEWEGTTQQPKKPQTVDSDDDEDPLEILVSSNSVFSNKKIVKIQVDPKPLITEQDIKEIQLHVDPVLEKVCKMDNLETVFRFLPHKSTEQPCPIKENKCEKMSKSQGRKGCEVLPLGESIVIEYNCQKSRKEMLEKQSTERLEAKRKELEASGLKLTQPPTVIPAMTKYRLPPEEFEECLLKNEEDDLSDDTISDDEQ